MYVRQSINHHYPFARFMMLMNGVLNITGLFILIYISYILLKAMIGQEQPISFVDVFQTMNIWLFVSVCLFLRANYPPEIISDQEGIHIIFLFIPLLVRWEEVQGFKPLFNLPFVKNEWVIRTSSLTPFHRLFGLIYSFSFSPSILVSRQISDFDELEKRIRSSLNTYQNIP
jgi:hypothetical protein